MYLNSIDSTSSSRYRAAGVVRTQNSEARLDIVMVQAPHDPSGNPEAALLNPKCFAFHGSAASKRLRCTRI